MYGQGGPLEENKKGSLESAGFVSEGVGVVPSGLVKLGTGEYLRTCWMDVAPLVLFNKVPSEWKATFDSLQFGSAIGASTDHA